MCFLFGQILPLFLSIISFTFVDLYLRLLAVIIQAVLFAGLGSIFRLFFLRVSPHLVSGSFDLWLTH